METVSLMHSGPPLCPRSTTAFVRGGSNVGIFHLQRSSGSSCTLSFSSRQNNVISRPFFRDLQPLHQRSQPCFSVRRRASSLGQRSINWADPEVDDISYIEEEQKQLLKKTANIISDDLRGTSIFLVGMMGSGKTTVGKHVADALGYFFFDSDKLVEDAGNTTVAQMFREGREEDFRLAESETLMQLSSHLRLVVATGGGAVVRPQNWGHMRHGVTVWLDVPLEALARRVVAAGCGSRPLLGQVSPESAYHQALLCLENLFKEREGFYKNADAVVSVSGIASTMGLDVDVVTPTMLAVQVVEEIRMLIAEKKEAIQQGGMGYM